jgi:hypothetical protein
MHYDWEARLAATVFGAPPAAGLDRPTHQAQVMVFTGTSFRAHGLNKETAIEPTPS